MKMDFALALLSLCAMVSFFESQTSHAQSPDAPLFPFVLPWDDATSSVTNLSDWLPKPAGKFGHIRVGDGGHLFAGRRRVRLLGADLCGGACFPRKEDAGRIAARMAKFGINSIRFHHMDSEWSPLVDYRKGNSRQLDPNTLERLDNFVTELKRNDIYADLNLLVSRSFKAADGLPAEIERLDWKERHVVGFFYAPILELQKEYARNFLTHRNRYTNLTYAEDPAVAFVEINNENGLLQAWLGGQIDGLPEVFRRDLQHQWNEWLAKRFGSTEKLRQEWGVKEEALGDEVLINADFSKSLDSWVLEQHEGAEATATLTNDFPDALRGAAPTPKSVRIAVTKLGTQGWHVQFNQPGLQLKAGRPYTLTLWAKADKPCKISVNLGQAHDPWQSLGFWNSIDLAGEWQPFRFTFELQESDDNARVNLSDLARQTGTCHLAAISLRPGGVAGLGKNERLEDGTIPLFPRSRLGERTEQAQRDWMRFLWETEDHYWQSMYRYLKDDLKVQALVFGTIVGCSTPNLMAKLDCVDTHAYWQHPQFPGRPWDGENWFVPNRTMVNERGGTLTGLALRRVLGKPHLVTEYNHSAPNTFSSEAFLLLTAYGALQDWDALYAFAYSHRNDEWNLQRIPNFFDIDQHPTKMVTLIPAAAMFLRGDVKAAREQIAVALQRDREIDLLRGSWPWSLVSAGQLGVAAESALMHRVAIATEGQPLPSSSLPPEQVKSEVDRSNRARFAVSDTGELAWDLSQSQRGVVTVNAPGSKAVIGYGGCGRFNLGGVVIEPGYARQEGWCAITVTVMEGGLPSDPAARGARPVRLLITATGYAENTDMGWKSTARDSVGRNWGKAPSLAEGIPARITLPLPIASVKAFALDERGQRKSPLPVESNSDNGAVITISPTAQTLWYEVEAK